MVLTASGIHGVDAVEITVGGLVVPYLQVTVIIVTTVVVMIIVFLAGIHYGRRRDLQQQDLQRDLHEPLLDTNEVMDTHEAENDETMENANGSSESELSSRSSIMNGGGNWSYSADGLGHPETYEGDIQMGSASKAPMVAA